LPCTTHARFHKQNQQGFSTAQGIELSPVYLRTPPELHVAHHDISRDNCSNISNANDSAIAPADDDEPSPKDLEPLVSVHSRTRSGDPPAFIGPAVTYIVQQPGVTAAGVTAAAADRRAAEGACQLYTYADNKEQ
jgi:hypothetical protein